MISGKVTSLGSIMYKVLRNPICVDLTYDQCAEFALEYIKLIGAPLSYTDNISEPLEIKNHKVALPKNVITVRGISCNGNAMRYASDIYHSNDDSDFVGGSKEYTYTLQNCVITTSMKEATIVVSYKSLETDEFGYPLIPDNESFKMGLEYYIIHRHLEPLWTMGKIQDKVFQYYEQKRHFYTGQAGTSMMVANLDHLETMMNAINRLIVDTNPQKTFYKNFGEKQIIKKY